jgi:hypothetical protein
MITLKLDYPHYDPDLTNIVERNQPKNLLYRVAQVTGSVDYVPGQLLKRDAVKDLCAMTGKFKIIVDGRKDK